MTEWDAMEARRGRPPKADAKRESLNVRMEPELIAALKSEAERRGVSPSELVRRLTAAALGVERSPQ
jgi:predicted HicB family RNase H-like nuclease